MFSRLLYHTLDHLGYNNDIIKFRRETYKYDDELWDKYEAIGNDHRIIAGSKGEGLTSLYESDMDVMFLENSILCINNVDQLPHHLPQHIDAVFLADMVNVPSGYTRLKLYYPTSSRNVRDKSIQESLFESDTGEVYLSSTILTDSLKKLKINEAGITRHDITGPALPMSVAGMAFDQVYAFTFHCPQLLQAWASRPRHHEWPSRDIIQTACLFLPQVVPTGMKGSDRQFQEWRFCFIESELTLTHSLNETQTKLYILLKMIAKSILKQVTSEISSYIMKNITYWLSELLPLHVFREEKLVSLVMLALDLLRTAISRWQNLPYYMIPSRNLLSERLDAHTRIELTDVLSGLLQEGPRLFFQVEKLRQGLEIAYQIPNAIIEYGKLHDQVEKNVLALYILRQLEKNGVLVCVESIEANLKYSIKHSVDSHMNALYPERCGRFSADEWEQAYNSLKS